MGSDPGSPRHASAPPSGRRLDSWKEIAEYLRRGITTVQRWEREEALPVRRHLHSSSGSVFPSADDIDAWLVGRSPEPTTPRREATTETASAPAQSVAVSGCATRFAVLPSPSCRRRVPSGRRTAAFDCAGQRVTSGGQEFVARASTAPRQDRRTRRSSSPIFRLLAPRICDRRTPSIRRSRAAGTRICERV
jgi:hypothetical protein